MIIDKSVVQSNIISVVLEIIFGVILVLQEIVPTDPAQ